MPLLLISLNPDLQRLRDEGYNIAVTNGYLVVRDVPYVNAQRQVLRGVIACQVQMTSEDNITQTDHTMRFVGEHPCKADGSQYLELVNGPAAESITPDLVTRWLFSQKPMPAQHYEDHYDKVTTYVAMLESQAQLLDPEVTAKSFVVVEDDDNSVFKYMDTASSRAGINDISQKLAVDKIAIVGLGGTGSYILDLVAKTHVRAIHLFDGDRLMQHNAFRMPGVLTARDMNGGPSKVEVLARRYGEFRDGVIAHHEYLTAESVAVLAEMNFVFLALTDGGVKRAAVTVMENANVPFIDVGMGINEVDGALMGQLRVTTSTGAQRQYVHERGRIPFSDGEAANEYAHNIQIADLNALNACLAVIRWKKLAGFYVDLEHEYFSVYNVDGNHLLNEDHVQ